MRKICYSFFAAVCIFLMFAAALAQPEARDIEINASGVCREFVVSVDAHLDGCWDAKIDAPGYLQHNGSWMHSFFYAPEAVCNGHGSVIFHFSESGNLSATLKLRHNTTVIEKDFFVSQSCPEENDRVLILAAAAIAVILAAAFLWYKKQK